MKLLIVFPSTLRGGTEEYALTIASGAIQAGWKVHASFPQTPETASLIRDFQAQGIHYDTLDIASVARSRLKYYKEYICHFLRVSLPENIILSPLELNTGRSIS